MAKKELVSSGAPAGRSAFLERLQKNFGVKPVADTNTSYIDVWNVKDDIPSLAQEYLVGARGWLAGRICQLRASFSKGKTSMMFQQYAAAQRKSNALCFHFETEAAGAPPDYVARFGCDPYNTFTKEGISSLEKCFNAIDGIRCEFRGGNGVDKPLDPDMEHPLVFGVDSLSQLTVDTLAQQDVIDLTKANQPGAVAKKMRDWFAANVQKLYAAKMLLFLTSHETAKIATGPMASFGGPQKTAKAQDAIGISATYAYDLSTSKWTASNGSAIGKISTFKCFKNKWSGDFFNGKPRSVDMYLREGDGFDLCQTDAMFLAKNPNSPFLWHPELSKLGAPAKDAYGWKWGALQSDKRFKTADEMMHAFYANADLLGQTREVLRLRGFGFGFEDEWKHGDAAPDEPAAAE